MNIDTRNKILSTLKELLPYLILIVVIILIKKFLFTTILVNGKSMNDTLKEKDFMILNKLSYKLNDIDRFDIVVVDALNEKIIKRVIGLPGEHIKFEDNKLYINGKQVTDSYAKGITEDFDLNELGLEVIPDDYYFVLGDNREDSLDSRVIGVVKKDKIIGTTDFIIYPFNRFGKVK